MPVTTRAIMKRKWKEACQVEHGQDESIVTFGPKFGGIKSKTKAIRKTPSYAKFLEDSVCRAPYPRVSTNHCK